MKSILLLVHISLLISGAVGVVEMKHVEVYTIKNQTVLLEVPECKVSDSDVVNWQKGKVALAKRMKEKGETYYRICINTCILHQNGSLLLPRIKEHTEPYTLIVYSSDGDLKCNRTLTVIVQAIVQDIFAASDGNIVIPLYTRLEHTSDILCNRFVWTFKRPRQYIRQLASVDDYCNKQDCNKETRSHCSLSSNGSLQLRGVKPDDEGQYFITTFHVNRARNTEDTFNLHVLDAVSKPVVNLSCVSEDQPVVLCRAEKGTNVSTSIIANGELLLEKAASQGEGQLFKVSSPAPWNISCSITNKVSQETINVVYSMCPVPLSEPHLEMLCHVDGSVEISCKTENGSEPSFSWLVDRNPVRNSSSWTVTGNVLSGSASIAVNITCSARNAISSVQSSVTTVFCPAATHSWTLWVFRKVLLFLQYNVLLIYLIYDVIRSNRIRDPEKP